MWRILFGKCGPMSYDKQQGMISQIYLYVKGHIFSFQNMHIHIYLHLESKPQNSECEKQNKPKPWTTVKYLFLHASYSCDSPLQEPDMVPHTFLLCFQDHCYLSFISILLSCIDSSSHQFPHHDYSPSLPQSTIFHIMSPYSIG